MFYVAFGTTDIATLGATGTAWALLALRVLVALVAALGVFMVLTWYQPMVLGWNAMSVILCDIDHFKRINDTHGHAAGDEVLDDFAGLLLPMTRDTVDSVIRYGGEKFLLVLPQTDLAGAQALAERIRHAFDGAASAVESSGGSVRATASFGIASVSGPHTASPASSEALIAAADAQLYAVKCGGRNGVRGTVVGAAADALASGG